jgi:Tol biopolymer transport system component
VTTTRTLAAGLALWIAGAATAGPAAAQYFGRNKVQYQVFDFQVLRTRHFDIYFYPSEREAVFDAARMAERAYARISRILQHEFDERKPIILYASHSDFQQTNVLPGFISEGTGGVTEFLKKRVVLPFTGSYAEFEHVLTHELVHAFQIDVITRSALAGVNPFAFQPPLWFMEGMAEYLSIGRVDPHTHAWVRDAVVSGYLRSVEEMNRRDDYLSYRFGQSLWAYIGAKWGDEAIGVILQRAPRRGLRDAFEATLGITLAQLSNEWLAAVRSAYLPEAAEKTAPAAFATRLTDHEFAPKRGNFASYLAPALSPDGEEVVFLSDRGNDLYGFFDLYLASARDGKVKARLVEAARAPDFESLRFLNSSAAWSPDGRHLAFVAKVGGRDALYVYDVRKRRVVRRIELELDGLLNPSWSPDGRRIVFTGMRGGLSDLYVVDADGRNFEPLTQDRYADLHPAWSPDGRRIAFATDRGPGTDFESLVFGNFRIAVLDLETGSVEWLPDQDVGKNVNPQWAPDGSAIAFVSDRTGVSNVYLYSFADGRSYRLTDVLTGISGITPTSPAIHWAARADRLAFVYFEGAGYNVYVVDAPRRLAQPAGPPPPQVAAAPPEPLPRAEPPGPADTAAAGTSESFYRTAAGFRPSAAAPAERELVHAELSVAALLDSATLALPDTSAFEVAEYRVKFTPDLVGRPVIGAQVGGNFGNGIYGGSAIFLSDMLGNHNILLAGQVSGSFNDAYILAQYGYLRERTNLGFGYEQFPLYGFVGSDFNLLTGVQRNVWLRDVYRTLRAEIYYPRSVFERLELGLGGSYITRDQIVERFDFSTGQFRRDTDRLESLVLAQPSVAWVYDNALFGFTGPTAGQRMRVQYSRNFGDLELNNVLVDLRRYLGLRGRFGFAMQFRSLWRSGPDADEFPLYWGGPYFIRGYDGGSFSGRECERSRERAQAAGVPSSQITACPVRDQLIGSSFALASLEFRFPVLNWLDLGFVPIGFPPIDGALFFEGGLAWLPDSRLAAGRGPGESPWTVRAPVSAAGASLRMNVFYTVLRLDYSVPFNRPDRRGGLWSFSIGPSF